MVKNRPVQLRLAKRSPNAEHPGWGGWRRGAGRKRSKKGGVPHRARPKHVARCPVHVTLRLASELGQLRTKLKLRAVKLAIRRTNERRANDGREGAAFRLIHFSLQTTHLHLIVEAQDGDSLSRGMRAFGISLARRLNAVVGRTGRVLTDRYHLTSLTTPRQTRAALAYVLLNFRRHGSSRSSSNRFVDPCSSGKSFDGWSVACTLPPGCIDEDGDLGSCTVGAKTWLLTKGWREHHPLISPNEIPGPP